MTGFSGDNLDTVEQLKPIPNQTIKVNKGDHQYDINILDADGFMIYDIDIDGERIRSGIRFVFGQQLLPYAFDEVDGNFILDMPAGEAPDYQQFNDTQFLRYQTPQESNEWREAWKNGRA